jgi:hypothetical protein
VKSPEELSQKVAPVGHLPVLIHHCLAHDDEINVLFLTDDPLGPYDALFVNQEGEGSSEHLVFLRNSQTIMDQSWEFGPNFLFPFQTGFSIPFE